MLMSVCKKGLLLYYIKILLPDIRPNPILGYWTIYDKGRSIYTFYGLKSLFKKVWSIQSK